jgi:hypothetical protein
VTVTSDFFESSVGRDLDVPFSGSRWRGECLAQHQVNLRRTIKKHHDTIRDMIAASSHVPFNSSSSGGFAIARTWDASGVPESGFPADNRFAQPAWGTSLVSESSVSSLSESSCSTVDSSKVSFSSPLLVSFMPRQLVDQEKSRRCGLRASCATTAHRKWTRQPCSRKHVVTLL